MEPALAQYGLPGIVIGALASVVVYQNRKLDKIQEQRISDAKEFGNKIAEPLESIRIMNQRQADLSEKMYALLIDGKGK